MKIKPAKGFLLCKEIKEDFKDENGIVVIPTQTLITKSIIEEVGDYVNPVYKKGITIFSDIGGKISLEPDIKDKILISENSIIAYSKDKE